MTGTADCERRLWFEFQKTVKIFERMESIESNGKQRRNFVNVKLQLAEFKLMTFAIT